MHTIEVASLLRAVTWGWNTNESRIAKKLLKSQQNIASEVSKLRSSLAIISSQTSPAITSDAFAVTRERVHQPDSRPSNTPVVTAKVITAAPELDLSAARRASEVNLNSHSNTNSNSLKCEINKKNGKQTSSQLVWVSSKYLFSRK